MYLWWLNNLNSTSFFNNLRFNLLHLPIFFFLFNYFRCRLYNFALTRYHPIRFYDYFFTRTVDYFLINRMEITFLIINQFMLYFLYFSYGFNLGYFFSLLSEGLYCISHSDSRRFLTNYFSFRIFKFFYYGYCGFS